MGWVCAAAAKSAAALHVCFVRFEIGGLLARPSSIPLPPPAFVHLSWPIVTTLMAAQHATMSGLAYSSR